MSRLGDIFQNIRQRISGGMKYLINRVTVRPPTRSSQDITKWRNAIKQAEGYTQQRSALYDLYEDIFLDGYLIGVTERRIENITNTDLVFARKNGKEVEEVNELIDKSFFEDLLTHIMEAKFWGHSLIEPKFPALGIDEKGKTDLIPRKNVKPRWGIVTKEHWDMKGVDYRKGWKDKIIEVGKPESLGVLVSVAQYVIYKRGDFGDWAEFATLFGIPFRHATYNNEQSRQALEEGLEKAGAAGYLIAPEGADLNFHQGNASGNGQEVFRTLRDACNEEIAYAVLGNTMTTTASKSSGYAQSKTHADSEAGKIKADRKFVLRVLNEQLIPYLRNLGYPVQDGKFQFQDEQHIPLEKKIDIDIKVADKVPVGPDYWYSTYGIPKPKKSELPKDNPKDEPGTEKPKDDPSKKKSRLELALNEYYKFHESGCSCGGCFLNLTDQPVPNFKPISSRLEQALIAQIRRGDFSLNEALHRSYYQKLREFARSGFGRSLGKPDNWADFELQEGIKRNINEFAAGKQNALIEELKAAYQANPKDFDRKAKAILQRYHKRYFEAELLTMEGRAQMAGNWEEFLKSKDLYPNLEFTTVGDDRVRQSHRALDGAIYSIDDSFWDTHLPPLDWRCRCVVTAVDKPIKEKGVQQSTRGFAANPFKSRRLIEPNHPYFNANNLDDLIETAEDFRAKLELTGIRKAAIQEAKMELDLAGLTATFTDADLLKILRSESLQKDTRNSILAAFGIALGELTAAGTEAGTGYQIFQVTALDTTFQLFFNKSEDLLFLKKATAI